MPPNLSLSDAERWARTPSDPLHGIVEFWSEDNDGNCLVQDDGPVHLLTPCMA